MSTTTILFQFTVSGTPAAVTSAVLSDPTGSFGVQRLDTNGTVVADSVALTNPSTGVYTYTFTDPAPGLTYLVWLEYVYNGVTTRLQKQVVGGSVAVFLGSTSYTLTTLRTMARGAATNARDFSECTPFRLDTAIRAACNEFNRATHFTKQLTTLDLSAGVADFDLTSLMPNFRPMMLLYSYLTGPNVKAGSVGATWTTPYYSESAWASSNWDVTVPYLAKAEWQLLNTKRVAENMQAQPQALGFNSWLTGMVYPIPQTTFTLNLLWSPPFTTWALGIADGITGSDNVGNFNLPDDVLDQIMLYGAPAFLQHNEPEHAYATESGKAFKDYIASMLGQGGLGARKIQRKSRKWFG